MHLFTNNDTCLQNEPFSVNRRLKKRQIRTKGSKAMGYQIALTFVNKIDCISIVHLGCYLTLIKFLNEILFGL